VLKLKGYKTYICGGLFVVGCIANLCGADIPIEALAALAGAAGLCLRAGVKKAEK
jgi:small-conductance mechanosensitive channel